MNSRTFFIEAVGLLHVLPLVCLTTPCSARGEAPWRDPGPGERFIPSSRTPAALYRHGMLPLSLGHDTWAIPGIIPEVRLKDGAPPRVLEPERVHRSPAW